MIINRNNISSLILIGLTSVLLIGATVSEFFQAPILSSKELSKLQFLFTQKEVESVTKLSIESGLGRFSLALGQTKNWSLTSPRLIDANNDTIENILESLKKIKIKKIYPKDAINLANFSLDKPISTISLENTEGVSKKISFGLINPIDNSTYVSLDQDKAIYHVNFVNIPLEKLELSALIDSRIFSMDVDQLRSVQIIGENRVTRLKMENKEKKWISSRRELDGVKVKKYLQELVSMKSHIILDKRTQKLEKRLERYLKRPFMKVLLTTDDDQKIEYLISYVINSLPDIKMEKKTNFIIKASNRQHPYLVDRSNMKLFYKKNSSFKSLPIKKLIY